MRRLLLIIPILAAIALLSATVPGDASAQSRAPFYWESIDVLIDVQENGDMLVRETQTYVFTEWHNNRRHRYIPLDKVDGIDEISVSMDDWRQMNMGPVNTGIEDGQQWIRWSHERLPSPEDLAFRERFCRAQVQNPELCIERYPKTFTFVWLCCMNIALEA